MTEIREGQLRADVKEFVANDPRIDSPDIKVIYPTPVEEMPTATLKSSNPVKEPVEETKPPQEPTPEKKEEHQCTVDIQTAIKQNLAGFIVVVILALGIGYLIGKK